MYESVCVCVLPERSDGGETFSGLWEVAEQRKLRGVIEILKVPERQKQSELHFPELLILLQLVDKKKSQVS